MSIDLAYVRRVRTVTLESFISVHLGLYVIGQAVFVRAIHMIPTSMGKIFGPPRQRPLHLGNSNAAWEGMRSSRAGRLVVTLHTLPANLPKRKCHHSAKLLWLFSLGPTNEGKPPGPTRSVDFVGITSLLKMAMACPGSHVTTAAKTRRENAHERTLAGSPRRTPEDPMKRNC